MAFSEEGEPLTRLGELARAEDRLGLLDLRLSELHCSVDLPLLTFHGEPLGALQQVPGTAVLARGNRGLRGFVEFLRFPDVGTDIAGDLDVVRHGTDRLLDLADPAAPCISRPIGRLDKTLAGRRELIPIEEIRGPLP